MTVLVFAEQSDTPVDAVVRELTMRDVPVFRVDTHTGAPITAALADLLAAGP